MVVVKNVVLLMGLVSTGFIQSCSKPSHPDAKRLCNCYTQVYRANEDKVDAIADSCSAIYIEIIKSLENDAEEKAKFDEAYEACQ